MHHAEGREGGVTIECALLEDQSFTCGAIFEHPVNHRFLAIFVAYQFSRCAKREEGSFSGSGFEGRIQMEGEAKLFYIATTPLIN
jgi:hypothetical protein